MVSFACVKMTLRISIHALRVEGDSLCVLISEDTIKFLSTPSGWRATGFGKAQIGFILISIHALRVEGDGYPPVTIDDVYKISIHALRVEGDDNGQTVITSLHPISIHALRVEGDNYYRSSRYKRYQISIHALRVEGDLQTFAGALGYSIFLSTPSGWRATAKTDKVFICFCAKGRRICLFKTRKEKNLPVAF